MKFPRSPEEVRFAEAQGRLIYDFRVSRDLTRRQLADAAGINQQALFRIEMGQATASAFDLMRLSRAFGLSLSALDPKTEPLPTVASLLSASARCRPVFA